jgi:CHAD domain-containing protein
LSKLTFSELADLLAKTYRRARGSIPKSWDATEAEDLHELRRRVVEHRYQMELIEPAWPRLGRIWVDEAQRLRTRLGKYQDLTVLAEKSGPHQVLAPWRSKLAPLIAHRQVEHAQAARKMAVRIFAEPPKAFRRRIEALWDAQTDEAED